MGAGKSVSVSLPEYPENVIVNVVAQSEGVIVSA